VLCALDISKAFDKTNPCALYIKLMHKNIPRSFLAVLITWLLGYCLLVRLRSEETASDLLRSARMLRQSSDNYVTSNIYFNSDLTPAQAKLDTLISNEFWYWGSNVFMQHYVILAWFQNIESEGNENPEGSKDPELES